MKIRTWLKKKLWEIKGKPMISYSGFNCGLCGAWVAKPFQIPTYQTDGEWWDTWGMCDKCRKGYGEKVYDAR